MIKTILILGGTGAMGTHLVNLLNKIRKATESATYRPLAVLLWWRKLASQV